MNFRLMIKMCVAATAMVLGTYMSAKAEDKTIKGMELTLVSGPFRYNSGGVPLLGYVVPAVTSLTPKTEKLTFIVCSTGMPLQLTFGDLESANKQVCSPDQTNPSGPRWIGWNFDSDKLVASQPNAQDREKFLKEFKGVDLSDIPVSDLPKEYQKVLTAAKPNTTAAFTFGAWKEPKLGIVNNSVKADEKM
jgi:hypothetical protein